jgi:hypothetical protein
MPEKLPLLLSELGENYDERVLPSIVNETVKAVGSASALVTFICVLCPLRTQISRSICNFTHYSNHNNNNNLTINMQLLLRTTGGGTVPRFGAHSEA